MLGLLLSAQTLADEPPALQYVRVVESESNIVIMQIGAFQAADCEKLLGELKSGGSNAGFTVSCTADSLAERLPVMARARHKTHFQGQLVRFDVSMLMMCRFMIDAKEWAVEIPCRLK